LTGVGSALLDWLTGGSALAALGKVSLAICALVFGLVYRRYLGILGADRRRPAERQVYDALRSSLAEGNLAARLYARRLTAFLDWIDRFFGDAGKADRTLFPHAFGLRTPAPLWTAPAFDRCLLLALIYPVGAIFVIWAVSGDVGPAEAALQLKPDFAGWQRGLAVAGVGLSTLVIWRSLQACTPMIIRAYGLRPPNASMFAWWRFLRTDEWNAYKKALTWSTLAVCAVVFAVGFVIGPVVAGAICVFAVALSAAAAGATTDRDFPNGAAAVSVVAFVVAVAFVDIGAIANAVALSFLAALMLACRLAIAHRGQGVFFSVFIPAMMMTCLGAANLLSPLWTWEIFGPLVLFFGLLTLVNAPFNWASLGLTRALLRRGLELGGWWPYALALTDAGLAAVITAALALTMVVGVQAFDALAQHGGGRPVLPLDPVFTAIAANPAAPEYWWLYAVLLSTMIPSLVNLMIGGTSLMRGLPGLPSLLLRKVPARANVPKFDRAWIATVLTAQVATGAALGIAVQALLAIVIIDYVMPFFGLELLDMAREVAAFNLPARVGHLFGVSL
jgi:hypothetical protein